ncbi:MAG: hypothetical protein VXZ40_01290 [Nanoarchaeota archaeon]|nr:hypothetical protein [Nanoarchaeota archaeon]
MEQSKIVAALQPLEQRLNSAFTVNICDNTLKANFEVGNISGQIEFNYSTTDNVGQYRWQTQCGKSGRIDVLDVNSDYLLSQAILEMNLGLGELISKNTKKRNLGYNARALSSSPEKTQEIKRIKKEFAVMKKEWKTSSQKKLDNANELYKALVEYKSSNSHLVTLELPEVRKRNL